MGSRIINAGAYGFGILESKWFKWPVTWSSASISSYYDLNQIYHLGADHPVLDIHAGTATSYRLHRGLPNSLNLIYPNADVEHYCFNNQLKRICVKEESAD